MAIKHELVADGDPLIDGDDWNANHKITNLLGYSLVEEKTPSAGTTTVTFSSLNGDEDDEYLIETDLSIVASSADRWLYLRPNGLTTNQKTVYVETTVGANTGANVNYLFASRNGWSKNGKCHSSINLFPKTGAIRQLIGKLSYVPSDASQMILSTLAGFWNDTTTNITSLEFTISGGSFSGTIRLWKKLPLS